jgi:hypothetical protein
MVSSNEDIEIRAGEGQVSGCYSGAQRNVRHDYKVLDANETDFERICRVYDERAEDRSWIFCQRSQAGTNMYLVVHE